MINYSEYVSDYSQTLINSSLFHRSLIPIDFMKIKTFKITFSVILLT